jgi:low affinity Fe/Cu permease
MTKLAASRGPSRSAASLLLSAGDRYASRPAAGVLVVAGTGAWLIVIISAGFPARWETIFQTVVAALTLVMVFVIQHTQARHQRATQRKLDEILLALPGTDNALVWIAPASLEAAMSANCLLSYQIPAPYSRFPRTLSAAYHRSMSEASPRYTRTPSPSWRASHHLPPAIPS